MLKQGLVESVAQRLSDSGYKVVACRGGRSSFDVLARRGAKILLVKVLSNVEGLSGRTASELKRLATILDAMPVVVGERMKSSTLREGVVYERYGVYVSTPETLSELVGENPPSVYSKRGNYCVQVNADLLSSARKRMGLTQESMAKELGVSKQSIYRYESSGRMSLEAFERILEYFGEGFHLRRQDLSYASEGEKAQRQSKVTSMKDLVSREFTSLGFETELTNAPFDLIAQRGQRVYSVVSNDWGRLRDKLSVLEDISHIMDGYAVCISERKIESETSVLSPRELGEISSSKELFKIISN